MSWGSRTHVPHQLSEDRDVLEEVGLSVPAGRCALKLGKAITLPLPAQPAELIHQHSPTAAPRGPGQELKPGRACYLAQPGQRAQAHGLLRGPGSRGPRAADPRRALLRPPAGSGHSLRGLGVHGVPDRELAGLPQILLTKPPPHPREAPGR